MSEFNISVPGGESKRLKTGGKYCPADIVVNAEKSAPVVEKDVNLWDYDGTLLYSYTLEELQSLTELPPLPAHDGLVCQGWNWTLADLKTYGKPYDVMPYYVTGDGATWFDIVNDTGKDISVTFKWYPYSGETVLDFGDNSESYKVTLSAAAVHTYTHIYAPGEYRAKLSGKYHLRGGYAVTDIATNACITLKRVFFGTDPGYLYGDAFRGCINIETVTMRNNMNFIGANTFYQCCRLKAMVLPHTNIEASPTTKCHSLKVLSLCSTATSYYGVGYVNSLKRLCLPDSLTSMHSGVTDNGALRYINIPYGTTSLPNNAFIRNYSLLSLDIPSSITSIGSAAFTTCESLYKLRFNSVTPPAVANANAFSGIPAWCVVEVPAESLTAYQQATNYGTIAAQMVGV